MKKALLVIDVQNYFTVDKAADLPQKIAWHIRESDYDHVLFAKFHNDPASNFHQLIHFTDATEAPSTDIHPDLTEFVTDKNVFEKTTYSALKSEPLLNFINDNRIEALDLCGISHDACVLATAFEAFDLGYKVEVLDNLCSVSSVRDELEDAAKTIINRNLRRKDFRVKRD